MGLKPKMPIAPIILLVDKDPEEAIPVLWDNEGCSVVAVKTGQEALAQVNQRPYDLVLLDENQPDKESLALLSSLKQLNPHCPIVILSRMLETKDKPEFLNHGAFDFLRKPFTADEVKDTLRRALEFKAGRKITENTMSGLIASGERFRAIVQAAQDAIILGDQEGNILSWNEAAQNMFGYTAEEVVGNPLTLLMPHRYRQAHQQGLERIRATGEMRVVGKMVELDGLRKGGEEFPIELSLSRSVETEEVFYCGIIRDISERKLAEQSLKESVERFQKIFATSNDAIFVCDLQEDRILNVNPRACAIFEYSHQELLTLPFSAVHRNEIHKFQAFCDSVGEKGKGWTNELTCITKSGRPIFCEISASTLEFEVNECMVFFVCDHSARQKVEHALAERENHFQLTLNNINDAVFYADLSGKILWVNEQALSLFERSLEDLIGSPLMECLSPEAGALAESRLASIRAGASVPPLVEFKVLRPDGSEKWIEANVSNVTQDGVVIGRILVGRDITSRKQSESALLEANQLLALDAELGSIINKNLEFPSILQACTETLVHYLDAAFVRIWILNHDTQVLELQASAGLYTHLNGPHSLVPIGHLKIGQIAAEKKPHLTNAVIGDPRIPEQAWAKREGLVAFAGYPLVKNHEVLGVMGLFARHTLTNVTLESLQIVADRLSMAIERQQALYEYQKLARHNERILASAGEGIYGLDLEGQTTFVNPAAASMLGYEIDELIGVPIHTTMHHTRPDGSPYPREECPICGAFQEGRNQHGENEILWRKDGTNFPVEYTSTPMWEDGRSIGAVVTFQDVTERNHLAEQFLEETKFAEVGRVVGDIGHDMKNMLMPVINGAKLVEDELEEHFAKITGMPVKEVEASRNFTKEALDMVVDNARRIQDRVREIADTVKGISSPLRLAACQVAEVVEEVFLSLRLYGREKGVSLHARGLDSLPLIHADTNRMFNALYNLVNNAIPETPVGGSVCVVGSLGPEAKTVVIRVVDTGGGMPPDIRDRLFTKGAISGKPGGTGLGTRIVKDVVVAHGGTITVDSEVGKGTTFTMELPIHAQPG
ncbi:MAG: PAS domain S-box protein [Nitrospirales bacterium]